MTCALFRSTLGWQKRLVKSFEPKLNMRGKVVAPDCRRARGLDGRRRITANITDETRVYP